MGVCTVEKGGGREEEGGENECGREQGEKMKRIKKKRSVPQPNLSSNSISVKIWGIFFILHSCTTQWSSRRDLVLLEPKISLHDLLLSAMSILQCDMQ